MAISVKLQVFEGPLDLLLHLIDVNKIDIYDIPIALITDQYLDYIHQMEDEDMDVMSEFLVMAATLLRIKSKMLLPIEEEAEEVAEDPRQELVERLLEYKMYKYAAGELRDMAMDAEKVLYKDTTMPKGLKYVEPPVDLDALVGDMNLDKLHMIFKSVMKRQSDKIDPIRSKYGKIEQEEINQADKMNEIIEYTKTHKRFSFRQLLTKQKTRMNTIVTFLSILELMKNGTIVISQEDLFDDILIDVVDKNVTDKGAADKEVEDKDTEDNHGGESDGNQ